MLIGNFLDKSTFKHLIEHCVLPGSVEGDEIQSVATMGVPSNLPEECYSYWRLGFTYSSRSGCATDCPPFALPFQCLASKEEGNSKIIY